MEKRAQSFAKAVQAAARSRTELLASLFLCRSLIALKSEIMFGNFLKYGDTAMDTVPVRLRPGLCRVHANTSHHIRGDQCKGQSLH
eukprot:658503-Pelagomonas_calceolata.AAC.1